MRATACAVAVGVGLSIGGSWILGSHQQKPLNAFNTAITECLANAEGYIGVTVEDNRQLFGQCLDDQRGK